MVFNETSMKKLIVIPLLFTSVFLQAQTYAEWFRQKKTQIKYLTEQIAALKVYATFIEKGYDITKKGLGVIDDLKHGDFTLHNKYFSSLEKINPQIKGYSKIAEIISLQVQIIQNCHRQKIRIRDALNKNEQTYTAKVFENVLIKCTDVIGQLILILSPGTLKMKDDERINHIDKLYLEMQQHFAFVKYFEKENNILVLQRMKEKNDIWIERELYNIH